MKKRFKFYAILATAFAFGVSAVDASPPPGSNQEPEKVFTLKANDSKAFTIVKYELNVKVEKVFIISNQVNAPVKDYVYVNAAPRHAVDLQSLNRTGIDLNYNILNTTSVFTITRQAAKGINNQRLLKRPAWATASANYYKNRLSVTQTTILLIRPGWVSMV